MPRFQIVFMALALIASVALASEEAKLSDARSWLRNFGENDVENYPSNHEASLAAWRIYSDRYAHLTRLRPAELSDEELLAAAEVFRSMASVGTEIARNSNVFPSVKETAAAGVAVYEEITARRRPTEEEAFNAYSAVFSLRLWELERRMRSTLGPLQRLPQIISDPDIDAKLSLWHLDPDFLTMKQVKFELTEDVKWIVLAFSDCSIAREAVSDIISDEALNKWFLNRSLWLTAPGPDAGSFPGVFVWNAKYPQFQLKFIHHMDEWPMLDMSPDSPTFVRIQNGKVVGVHSGWGTGKYLPEVRRVLTQIEERAN